MILRPIRYMSDKVEAVIKPLTKGTELELGIEFKSTTASLSPSSHLRVCAG